MKVVKHVSRREAMELLLKGLRSVAAIFASHPDYVGYGQPDTKNTNDNVVGNQALATFTLDVARMDDGAMLASTQLVVAV
jgi:hypothetical protein